MATKANCYLCGSECTKTYATRHLAKCMHEGSTRCMIIKAEGAWNKDYWIYFDMPLTDTLEDIDEFLRRIWLECCGHMSAFEPASAQDEWWDEDDGIEREEFGLAKATPISKFSEGDTLRYEYDFGSTTALQITFVKRTTRDNGIKGVRLLMRNQAPQILCECCHKAPADNALDYRPMQYLCKACNKKHIKDNDGCDPLPITNSPRCGVCDYTGSMDTYGFSPANLSPNLPGDSVAKTSKTPKKSNKTEVKKKVASGVKSKSQTSAPKEAEIIPFDSFNGQLDLFKDNQKNKPLHDSDDGKTVFEQFLDMFFSNVEKVNIKEHTFTDDIDDIPDQTKKMFLVQMTTNLLNIYGILTRKQIEDLLKKSFPYTEISKSDFKYLFAPMKILYVEDYDVYAHPSFFTNGSPVEEMFEQIIIKRKGDLHAVNAIELVSFENDLLWNPEYKQKVTKMIKKYKIKLGGLNKTEEILRDIWCDIQTATLFNKDPKVFIKEYIESDKTGKLASEFDEIVQHTRLWALYGRMPCEKAQS